MKLNLKLATAAALALPLVTLADNPTLTQAQITQIIKDVQTIDPGKGARAAVMKETLQGQQAVRTGIDSRTELLFNDHTITRLGSNTHFSFSEGTRNMSLESGVMLLQVPKGNGGAKIETAAVTAAVTGTTIMVEAGLTYTKLIVLEGECCLWPKDDKNKNKNELIKFKHKTCVKEGQEVILRNGAKQIPDPVYVNLKVLEGTSLLITGDWNSPLNTTPINTAANDQGPTTYIPTNLAIIGAGTDVTVIQGQVPPPGGTPPPAGNTPTPPIPGKYGALPTIPGGTTLGGGSTINTDPKIIAGGQTAYGRIYRGTILDGPPVPYLFGAGTTASFPDLIADDNFPSYGVAAFKFGSLHIQGMPSFEASGNGATALGLISVGDITVSAPSPTTLDFTNTPIIELALGTAGGNIDIDSSITVQGLNKFEMYSSGAANNIQVDGNVSTNTKYYATTQGNYTQNGTVFAGDNATVFAGGNLVLNNSITTYDNIDLEAHGNFSGDGGSVSAPFVTLAGGVQMTLDEQVGDDEGPNTDSVNGVQIDMNALEELGITGNGIVIDNGFTGESYQNEQDEYSPNVDLSLYSQDDGVAGSGTISLDGYTYVEEFTAYADSDITLEDTVESIYDVSMTSYNGSIQINGTIYADNGQITLQAANDITISAPANLYGDDGTQITATNGTADVEGWIQDYSYINITAGANIMTGSDSFLSTSYPVDADEGDETSTLNTSITLTSTSGSGTVTTDGDIESGTITLKGYNVHTLTTGKGGGIYGSQAVNIYASNDVTMDGYIQTPTLTISGTTKNAVPVNVTLSASGVIDADNVTIKGGIVDIEGFITSDENEFGATQVTIDTTHGTGPLMNENDSFQDFFSTSGGGGIDSQTTSITSRGDLILEDPNNVETSLVHTLEAPEGYDTSQTVNGVQINPHDDLLELDLTGATVEAPDGFQIDYPTTLKLTSTAGDIAIGGSIYLHTGEGPLSELDVSSAGDITISNGPYFEADTVKLSANNINTDDDGLGIYTENASITTGSAHIALANDSDIPSTFYITEYSTGSDASQIGSVNVYFQSGTAKLDVSANILETGDIYGYEYDSLSVSLTSATDINGFEPDESATIYGATSVALQVGVPATLAGDTCAYISYNGGQLYIDSQKLGSFSVTASSINVDEGFPTLEEASLALIATGSNGITVDTASLYTPSGSITLNAQAGDVVLNSSLTASGAISITGNDISQNEGGSITSTGSSVTLNAPSGYVSLADTVTSGSGGNISITSGSYIHTLSGATLTTATGTAGGGNLILAANGGNINLGGDLSVSGSFSAIASGSVIIGEVDPTIGGDMYLSASGGSIEINNNITINGNLTLSASDYIHSIDGARILGATSVTLTLTDNPAELSVTTGSSTTLLFGVPAADEVGGYGPIKIDLTNVISGYSSITASATSLTLTSAFNEPNTTLTLNATDGDLITNGAITAFDFYPSSSGGDITINDGVTAGEFSGSSSGAFTQNGRVFVSDAVYLRAYGGNLVVNGQVFASSFDGYASGMVTGTGSIYVNTVIISQSGSGTVDQTDATHLVFNSTLTAVLSSTYVNTEEVELSAYPLKLSSPISLLNIGLYISGDLDTAGNAISAYYVGLEDVNTTTDTSGNATNLTAGATSTVQLDYVSLDGADGTSGSGGTLVATGTATGGSHVALIGYVSANGGSGGGAGGTITLTSANEVNASDASLEARGGTGGGAGGTINITSQNSTIASFSIDASGGDASPTGTTPGGNGGSIMLTTATDLDFEGTITANGGDANPNSGAAGGNGGTVTLDSDGALTADGNIKATSGANGNTKWTGGNGGTVSLTAAGAVTVNSSIEVSSSDLVNNRVSAKGGNINITSHAAAGNTAININNSGQLLSLLNQAAAGPGGQITFLADQGGNINVSGSLRADAGTIDIRTTGTATGGQVNINAGATLSADVIKVGVLSPNGTLTVGGNGSGSTRMNGDTLISLYAAGDNGSVVFAGNTFLTGAGLKSIAGSTVTINNGVNVFVGGGAATVYTNTPNYQGSGGNGNTNGQFIGNTNTTTKPFTSRPAF